MGMAICSDLYPELGRRCKAFVVMKFHLCMRRQYAWTFEEVYHAVLAIDQEGKDLAIVQRVSQGHDKCIRRMINNETTQSGQSFGMLRAVQEMEVEIFKCKGDMTLAICLYASD
mgnify:CR=1 FL=1